MDLLQYKQYSVGQPVVDHLDYRGYSVDFYEDPYGKQVYADFEGNRVDFGSDNMMYKDDYQKLVDDKLDTISRFPKFPQFHGARLTWFDNGGFRDIKLIHWNRTLKIYLVADPSKVELAKLYEDAKNILDKLIID